MNRRAILDLYDWKKAHPHDVLVKKITGNGIECLYAGDVYKLKVTWDQVKSLTFLEEQK